MQQIDSKDCSLIVLNWFHNHYYHKSISLSKLKANVLYSDTGVSIKQLQNLSAMINIKLQSFSCDYKFFENIEKSELPFGALIKENDLQHMVIITKIKANKITYIDPINGVKKILKSEFMKIYLGVLFKFSKAKTNNRSLEKQTSFKIYFYIPYLLILLISLVIKLATPFVTKILLGNVYFSHSYYDLTTILIIFIWMQISSQFFYVLSYKTVNKVIMKKVYDKNNRLLNIIENRPNQTLFKYSDTEIMNRFNAIKEETEFKFTFWSDITVDSITVISAFVFLFYANKLILLICLFYSLLCLFINVFVTKKTKFYYSKLKEKTATYNSNVFGILNYLRTNKNNKYYEFLNSKTKKSLKTLSDKSYKNFSFLNFWNSVIELFTNIMPFAVYLIAIISFWNSGKQLQEFIFYLTGINLITVPIKSINSKIMSWKNNEQNIFLLETFNYYEKNKFLKRKPIKDNSYFIEINNLILNLKGKKIIDIPKISIKENICITGKNGKGKSTLLKLIAGLYDDYKGEIFLVNNNNKYNLKEYSYEFGFVTSDEFFPNLTLKEYLTNNNKDEELNLAKTINKYDLNFAFEIMNVKLDTYLINNASNLSTGQKKFISIIKLLSQNSKIIMLDEAFENLDKNVSKFLKECIKDKFNNSIFIEISHNNNYIYENQKEFNIEKINKE